MIPFGPFAPDSEAVNANVCVEAVNCLPAANGYDPLPSPISGTTALDGECRGAVSVISNAGAITSYAGDPTKLYRLAANGVWTDATRLVGGNYNVPLGDRWSFTVFGPLLIASNIANPMQKFDVTADTRFSALGGSPPQARYVATVRDFVFAGCLASGQENVVQWSGLGNAEQWTPGTNSSDVQVAQSGGPVRGLIGGESAYVFQASKVNRFTFAPGSTNVFDVDEIGTGRGLLSPASLVERGQQAYYLSPDGLYQMDTVGGASRPLGIRKWSRWLMEQIRPGYEGFVIGGVDPFRPLLAMAYVSRDTIATLPNRLFLYDITLDDATVAEINTRALMQWLSQGVSLDSLGTFGTLDTLPFSLDSPFWRGGSALFGLFREDKKLSVLSGTPLAARWVTADGSRSGQRMTVRGTRPLIDTSSVTVALAAREADGDPITFDTAEAREDTGVCPSHVSGNLIRARIEVPSTTWTNMTGLVANARPQGSR